MRKIIRLFACVMLALAMSVPAEFAFAHSDVFEAASLSTQKVDTHKQLVKSKDDLRKYISSGASKYKLDLTANQKAKLSKLKKSLAKVKSIKSVKAKRKVAYSLFKKAKSIHKKKSSAIKAFGEKRSEWAGYMTANQKSKYKELVAKMRKARSTERISTLRGRFEKLFEQVALMPYVNSDGWSSRHVTFVSDWGKRNNDFLWGTPMSGLGYYIADSAWRHDIDPRLYSAIANVESGCGVAPYGSPYNCCGWVWNPPYMYSYQDGIDKWHDFFAGWWKGDWYPIDSMHGYGAYGPWYVNVEMEKI